VRGYPRWMETEAERAERAAAAARIAAQAERKQKLCDDAVAAATELLIEEMIADREIWIPIECDLALKARRPRDRTLSRHLATHVGCCGAVCGHAARLMTCRGSADDVSRDRLMTCRGFG
jgi:hypothetical protein